MKQLAARLGYYGKRAMAALPLILTATLVNELPAVAQDAADSVPSEIQNAITAVDQAASAENLEVVMEYISRDFVHSDGLTYDSLEEALERFWERYDDLTYTTQVNSWEQDGEAIVTETTTQVTGTQSFNGRTLQLDSTLRSRQRYLNGQIVEQTTLAEDNRVTSGENPPEVNVQLPEQVLIGQSFAFDAIVTEPLGDRQLLGTALDEPVTVDGYLAEAPLDLDLLPAGGIFKVGRAPALPEQRWISGIIIREDGLIMITRRVRFETD
ncbi:MAG: nuclear transport factor 2 family protein [Cyanobacteria bacterium J06638_22]